MAIGAILDEKEKEGIPKSMTSCHGCGTAAAAASFGTLFLLCLFFAVRHTYVFVVAAPVCGH